MSRFYAIKQGVRYRYYISTSAMQARDRDTSATHRLPAPALETAIIDALRWAIEKRASRPGVKEAVFEAAADLQNNAGTIDGCASRSPASSLSTVERNRSLIENGGRRTRPPDPRYRLRALLARWARQRHNC